MRVELGQIFNASEKPNVSQRLLGTDDDGNA
jgi:hypothetical protein